MISRVIFLCSVIGFSASNLLPVKQEPVKPLTLAQLQAKAKYNSLTNVCNSKRKAKTNKNLCRRINKHLTSSN